MIDREARGSGKKMQKARAGQSVSDDDLARYTAARAFLLGEWVGALLMVGSFSQLYWFTFARPGSDLRLVLGLGVAALALGTWMFLKNRRYYLSLEWPYRKKWEVVATVFAGAGGIFWLLFLVLLIMTWAGSPVLPE